MAARAVFSTSIVIWAGLAVASAHAETVRIAIAGPAFQPAETSAKVGDTVEWTNNDILSHTATASNGDWTVTMPAKTMGRVVLKKAGTVEYYCTFHPNMKGRIIVSP